MLLRLLITIGVIYLLVTLGWSLLSGFVNQIIMIYSWMAPDDAVLRGWLW